MTKYVLQYRAKMPGRDVKDWQPVQEFAKVEDAIAAEREAKRHERRGTKDWRVRVEAS